MSWWVVSAHLDVVEYCTVGAVNYGGGLWQEVGRDVLVGEDVSEESGYGAAYTAQVCRRLGLDAASDVVGTIPRTRMLTGASNTWTSGRG